MSSAAFNSPSRSDHQKLVERRTVSTERVIWRHKVVVYKDILQQSVAGECGNASLVNVK